MKKIFWMTMFGAASAALFGCPIYSDSSGSTGPCQDGPYASSCASSGCQSDYDCANGYVCSPYNQCVPAGTTTPDSGDCLTAGCPTGFTCTLAGGVLGCVSNGDGGSPSGDGGTPNGDASDGSTFSGCQSASDCASLGAGAQCLDGTCVAAQNQCSDATQCPAGEQCVQGVCTPSCGSGMSCPTGYSCDTNGTCSGNPAPCGSGGTACSAGLTCVEQHCVNPCSAGDAACPAGLVCVDGGCIPQQIPNFVCTTEGMAGDGLPNDCAVGSVCLHHNCYISCDPDAGSDACKTADQFNICKQVTTSTGSYNVCGSASNLGNQCDPTSGMDCTSPGQVCIDGFCK